MSARVRLLQGERNCSYDTRSYVINANAPMCSLVVIIIWTDCCIVHSHVQFRAHALPCTGHASCVQDMPHILDPTGTRY